MTKQPTEKRLHTSGKELGVGKDGYQQGGIKFKAPLGQPTKNNLPDYVNEVNQLKVFEKLCLLRLTLELS